MNPLNAYKETTIKTAGQGKLIVMLYDECLKQLDIAQLALSNGAHHYEKAHHAIVKAQDIITELNASLDLNRGGDIAQNLMNLYIYFNQRLMEANLEKEVYKLIEVRDHMKGLGEAWLAITAKMGSVNAKPAGINIAG
jgi:flagellar protein FliS